MSRILSAIGLPLIYAILASAIGYLLNASLKYLVIIFAVTFIVILLSHVFDSSAEKIDKGRAFFYWHLSYKRRFIRGLWMVPFAVLVIALILFFPWTSVTLMRRSLITLLLAAVYVGELIYDYIKWKSENTQLQ
ncbi:hypothetical protein ACFO4N_15895 [Camelliibacillus cellulosilyticus]|uniref:Uncharacterized protein n=1 Tax=Camelliibacillus cellulosilyticus TaxID=2174486 RepID=A0ABV9GSP5_9BACL